MSELDDRLAREMRAAYEATPPLDPDTRERLMEAVRQSPPPLTFHPLFQESANEHGLTAPHTTGRASYCHGFS